MIPHESRPAQSLGRSLERPVTILLLMALVATMATTPVFRWMVAPRGGR